MADDGDQVDDVEDGDDKKARRRNPAHPIITLQMAIDRVRKVHEANPRRATSPKVMAQTWEMKPTSSTTLQNISSLKQYGLLEDAPDGKGLMVTELAYKILLDKRPESTERQKAIKKAALTPRVMEELWKESNEGAAQNHALEYYLTAERPAPRFYEDAAPKVISIFRSNLAFAGLQTGDTIGDTSETRNENAAAGDLIQWESNGQEQFPLPRLVTGLSEDGQWAFVDGSPTGIPIDQIKVVAKSTDQQLAGKGLMVANPPLNPSFKPLQPDARKDTFTLRNGHKIVVEWSEVPQDEVLDVEEWWPIVLRKIKRSVPKQESA